MALLFRVSGFFGLVTWTHVIYCVIFCCKGCCKDPGFTRGLRAGQRPDASDSDRSQILNPKVGSLSKYSKITPGSCRGV